ncbi:MAG: ATP-dependent DNA ligase [Nocardiaceae bacterium]|nr:ATP-dependent DNA ligase [Nocardiaceae bacterium]
MTALSFGDLRLEVTNLDKVLYPETGTTKGQVIDYYVEIAPAMLPHIIGRPVTRNRWPNGVNEPPFFEKNLVAHAPSWISRRAIAHSDREVVYPIIENVAGLAWLGQQASLEIHVPQWTFTDEGMGPATRLVFDLDPGEGVGLTECAEVAVAVRDMVAQIGLAAFPVTSGSKGIHIYVPLDRALSPGGSSTVAKQVARNLETLHPRLVTSNMSKAVRVGKVFLDWSQNNEAKTTIAPYSMRGRKLPTAAAPRTWAEIENPDTLRHLMFDEVLERYRRDGDLLRGLDPVSDSLDKYRSMRDARKTPEPMPLRVTGKDGGNSFVIQEHHARRLHYDVRLERDGVLASWAVPKGPPTTANENHLAVRTEDHPIEYLTFAGTIPKGEYGAGVMTIWDTGTYETEKWRDDEVIVRLRGEKVTGRYALIRTQGDQWLMHFMRDQRIPEMPSPIAPMLASPGEIDRLSAGEWAFEGKWDGYRLVVEITGGRAVARSRNGNDLTDRYPVVSVIARELEGHNVVLDGEIVVRGQDGITNFGLLQQGGKTAEFVAFDVLFLDGVSLINKPWRDRRKILEAVKSLSETLQVPPLVDGDGATAHKFSQEQGWEGIIAKRRDSTYLPGKRANTWIKAKNWQSEEFVIGGWRPGAGGRSIGALLVGTPSMNGLRFAGRVGTGFTDRAMVDLINRLAPLRRDSSPFEEPLPALDAKDATWVDPMLVGEVRFTEWTSDGRMRHPAWRGLVER